MNNFNFLKNINDLQKLHKACCDAECFCNSNPDASVIASRKASEFVVKLIYCTVVDNNASLTTFDMLSNEKFISFINNDSYLNTLHYIRKIGNIAVHEGDISNDDALDVLEKLHYIVGQFCRVFNYIDTYPAFVKPSKDVATSVTSSDDESVEVEAELVTTLGKRMRDVAFDISFGHDEEKNKKLFMHACFREAGIPVQNQKNQAMPNSVGLNLLLDDGDEIDYVIYGRDNKPLAIVEYTTTSQNIIEGRNKGIEKANKLAKKYGYTPIVYYTNGYHIYVIDQLGYPPRRVFQFHSIEELELLRSRANSRKDISNPVINTNITDRKYQKEAITAVCNALMKKRRHSLLVMATGTGKTRVAISLVDVLMKNNIVKNVLFLADRTSLVRQANKNFTKLLPSVTTTVYSGGSLERDPNARIVFSTYQTMINLINDDTREFGIGRFDAIIIDEAHRSIFKKYGALFKYFDSLMIGLTATPRSEENKSTYKVFELKDGNPDYAYELNEAIKDNYLVGFSVLDKTTNALKRGIHYDDLSAEEKEAIEGAFEDDEDIDVGSGFAIGAQELSSNKYINIGTIKEMLNDLMKNGLKINGGDSIGKSIVFAKSHVEAEVIVSTFQKIYGYLGDDFCKLIDSKVDNNQNLIDRFGERDQLPRIAVSVDMLDTGIDVPDVLNLVFYKTVRSKIKFLQMIGRGTRLSPNVFGEGQDKKGFLIFDYFDNFNYFRVTNTWEGIEGDIPVNKNIPRVVPQTVLINERKFDILRTLTETDALTTFDISYKTELKQEFIDKVLTLSNDDIEVQNSMSFVNKYRVKEIWDKFDDRKENEIKNHIIPLLHADETQAKVKNFDALIYTIESEGFKRVKDGKEVENIKYGFENIAYSINRMIDALKKLKTIPAVNQKEKLLNEMADGKILFNNFSLEKCEKIRKELRGLMSYIPDDRRYYIFDTKDYIINGDATDIVKEKTYQEKVQEFLLGDSPLLAKIRNLDELADNEKKELEDTFKVTLGNETDYVQWSNNKPLLPFLRIQVGIADEAIDTKFGSFLNKNVLNEKQFTYMEQIVAYARQNGDIVFLDLQQVSPFCDADVVELFGEKIMYIKQLINGLHNPVR